MQFKVTALPVFIQPPAWVKTPFRFSYVITLGLCLSVLVYYFRVQPQIPLYYTLSQPSQQLANKQWLGLFPLISLTITIAHLLIVQKCKNYNVLLIQLFSWTTVMIQVLLALALFRIIMIVS